MVRRFVREVKVQRRKSGSIMVTVPKVIVNLLNLRGGVKLKVYVDLEKNEFIYKIDVMSHR